MSRPAPSKAPRLAYLVSQYPATSHTFILREVLGLRERGFDIATASINADPRPAERITMEERGERENTYVIKRHGIKGALSAHAWSLAKHPAGYLRGLRAALRRGALAPRDTAWSLFHFTEALMLGRWMARQSVDHLHVHFATAAASVASLARQVFPIRLSMTVHGPDEFANVKDEHFAEKVAACDLVVCISHFARSQTMQHSAPRDWHKFEVVRLGVEPQRYAPAAKAGGDGRPFTLLCVGRLTPAKGQHLLLDAVARLAASGDTVRLVLVGDGPDGESLRRHAAALDIESAVTFTGALNQDEVRARYADCDAFVLPSFAEGIPVVLMEAMASGVPCLSTRVAGIPELIADGETGFLVPPSDVEALTERIRELMRDEPLRERLAARGRQRVAEAYDLTRNIGQLAGVFRRRLADGTA